MSSEVRGYGGYRLATGFGIGRFTGRQVSLVAGVAAVVLITMNFSFRLALVEAAVAVPVIVVGVVPWGSARRTIAARVSWFVRRTEARARSLDAVAAGPLREVPRGETLPGVLAPLLPLDVEDGRGGTQCLLWNRRTGVLSVVLLVSPVGITLADAEDANSWVTTFGGWMADLGYKPMISSVSFTVESSPTGGVNQRSYTQGADRPERPGGRPEGDARAGGLATDVDGGGGDHGDHQLRPVQGQPAAEGFDVGGGGGGALVARD